MASQSDIKRISSLSMAKYRQKYAQFVVEGRKLVQEVFHSGLEIQHFLVTEEYRNKNETFGNPVVISDRDMKKISHHSTPPGIAVVVKREEPKRPEKIQGANLFIDGVSDPGNLGALLRIADWYGLTEIWLSEDSVDETNPKVIASSMGSFLRVKCIRTHDFPWQNNIPAVGADLKGDSIYSFKTPTVPYFLVMGSESHGLREETRKTLTNFVHIPKKGGAESLNLSVSTGIILDRLMIP